MKLGDKLRISERKYRKQEDAKVSQGKIVSIAPGGITIQKENGTNETFNIGDLINKGQKKEICEGEGWTEIEGRREGKSIALCKKFRTDN